MIVLFDIVLDFFGGGGFLLLRCFFNVVVFCVTGNIIQHVEIVFCVNWMINLIQYLIMILVTLLKINITLL